MPAPPPESEPAIESTAGTGGASSQVRRSRPSGPSVERRCVLSGCRPMASIARGRPARRLPGERGGLRRGVRRRRRAAPVARAGLEAVARAGAAELPGPGQPLAQARRRALLLDGGRPRVLRRPRAARDHRRRLGAGQARPRPARPRAERVRRRRLRRAADRRRGRRPARGHPLRRLLRAGACAACSRPAASGSASPAWTSSATHNGEWLVLEDNVRTPAASPTCTPPGARCSNTRRAARRDARARWTARSTCWPTPCAPPRRRRPRPPRARRRRAHRRRAQLRLLGARLALAPARHPAGRARRARGPRRRAVAARPRPARAAPDRRRLPAHERRPPRLRPRPPADRAGPARQLGLVNQYGTGVADDKLTHAYVEDDDPLLRRRGAGPALRPHLRPRPARAARSRRSTSSTSWSSSRAPVMAASAC